MTVAADTLRPGTTGIIAAASEALVAALNQDNREGMLETPVRVAKFWQEFLTPPSFDMTTFPAEGMDEMVVQAGIPFYSMCEHHLLPFFGTATVAYLPDGTIVGLSKLARAVRFYASRPQNQERITKQVADLFQAALLPKGVAVVLSARHLCMEMRGIKTPGALTTTIAMLGRFRDDPRTRAEFMAVAR